MIILCESKINPIHPIIFYAIWDCLFFFYNYGYVHYILLVLSLPNQKYKSLTIVYAPVPLSRILSANQYELAFVAHRTAPYWFELLRISLLPLSY